MKQQRREPQRQVRNRGQNPQGPHREAHPPVQDTKPPIMPSGDYSYTVEIVMNMQHTLGKLSEAVDGLKTRQAEQGEKLNGLDKKIYAAIVLLTVFGALLTYFSKSINDALTNRLLQPATQQYTAPAPIAQPTQANSPVPKGH